MNKRSVPARASGVTRRRVRILGLLAGMVLVGALPAVAVAAAPLNDLPGGAIAYAAIPVTIDQDTSDATVTTDDIGCGSGGEDQATVWYTLTLGDTTEVLADATGSGYDVGVNVFADSADAGNLVTCVGGAAAFTANAGTTYYLMFADIDGNATNGGQLHVTIDVAPPPLEVSLTVDASGKVNPKTGEATIRGTLTCSRTADFGEVDLTLRESVGRFTIHGSGFASSSCDTTPTAWFVSVVGDNGKFGLGRATADVSAFACDATSCGDASALVSVRLRK
jgi:hypothetical protein